MPSFGQTVWGNISITLLMVLLPLLPIIFVIIVLYLNHLYPQLIKNSAGSIPARILTWVLTMFLILFALFCLALFSIPFKSILSLAVLMSPDHNVASLNEAFFAFIRPFAQILGVLCLVVAGWMIFKRTLFNRASHRFLLFCAKWCVAFIADARDFFFSLKAGLPVWKTGQGKVELALLAGLSLLGAVFRSAYLNAPFIHDAAYTYVGFASRNLRAVVTDYSLPNNHVFHTILVYCFTQLFGPLPWAVRLGAYLPGILCIPAVYFLAKRLYNPRVALLSAALVTAFPDLVTRSSDARGYMLLTLFTLIIFWLGDYVRLKPNRLAWLSIVIVSSLGFYTIPTMLFSYGALLTWLTLSALFNEIGAGYGNRWQFILTIFWTGLLTILCTLSLYSTIFIGSGLGAFFGNGFIKPLSLNDFLTLLPLRVNDLWHDWKTDLPFEVWIASASILVSILLNKKLAKQWVPWLGATLLWIIADLIIQRPDPVSRLWTFLLPLFLIAIASAWDWFLGLLQALVDRLSKGRSLPVRQSLLYIVMVLMVAGAGFQSALFCLGGGDNPGPVEKMVTGLSPSLKPGDWVISVSVYEPPMWYYFRYHNISWTYLEDPKGREVDRYLIVVYGDENETVESIFQKRKIDPVHYDLTHIQVVEQNDNIKVYAVPAVQ